MLLNAEEYSELNDSKVEEMASSHEIIQNRRFKAHWTIFSYTLKRLIMISFDLIYVYDLLVRFNRFEKSYAEMREGNA